MSTESNGAANSGSIPVKTRKSPRIGRSFSSRNPLPIGVIGLVFLLVLLYAAFNASSLPLVGGGTMYHAEFRESASLKSGDDVRIAGVKVGQVENVSIDTARNLVKVDFTVKDGWVGNQSTVNLKLKTLLGAKYLSINSQGTGAQDASKTIRVDRTTSPFDVYPAFDKLTKTVQDIDTAQLAKSFQVIAADFTDTPASVRPLVTGMSRLSTTIASRDVKLRSLLQAANQVSGTLASRDQDLARLLEDGNALLGELNARRDAIHSLLINTQVLSVQLRGIVSDNEKTIGPLLDNLDTFLNLLRRNQDSLERGISLLGPFYRLFNNVIGNGHWFDNYIENLSPCGLVGVALKIDCYGTAK
jgi:phospholipid/cholesterol/gamma-HCH transport system substrate-binding protein